MLCLLCVVAAYAPLGGMRNASAADYIQVVNNQSITGAVSGWNFFMDGGIGNQNFGQYVGVTSGRQYQLIGSLGPYSGSKYAFDHWAASAASGSISITDAWKQDTRITPSGSGFIGTMTMYAVRNDFSISASPKNPPVILAGNEQQYTVTVTDASGASSSAPDFQYTVDLNASGLPTGATQGCSGCPVTVHKGQSSSATMRIFTSTSSPAGSSTLTITGTISGVSTSHSDTVTLNIQQLQVTTITVTTTSSITTTQPTTSIITQWSYTTTYSIYATTTSTLTTVAFARSTVTLIVQSIQYLMSTLTTTLTSYTDTTSSTRTVSTTVALLPLTNISTAQSTQYVTLTGTTTMTSYTGTATSTSTVVVPTTVTMTPSASTSTFQTTQVLTSTGTTTLIGYRTTTVTSYTGTETSTSTVPTVTTVALVPLTMTSTIQSTEFVTSVLTTTETSYTATTTSTSTVVVYTTVTKSGAGAGPSSSLAYLGFISLLAVTVGRRVTTSKSKRIFRLRSRVEGRCLS